MTLPSRRTLFLISGVVLAIVANIVLRFASSESTSAPAKPGQKPNATANQIIPSVAGLTSMAQDWQGYIAALPPESRPAAQAKFDKVKASFMQIATLPAAERSKKMKEQIAALMNDPETQEVMMEQRTKNFTKMDNAARHKMLKGYVNYKSSVTGK